MTAPAELPAPYDGSPLVVGWVGNYQRPWCSEQHFTASVEALGHRMIRWQEDTTDWPTILADVKAEGVQVVFWTRTWPAETATVLPVLDDLRAMGVPTVAYHLDLWWGLNREHQVHDQPFFRCGLVVSPDDSPKWATHGINHLWLPPGVYDAECGPVPPDRRRFPHDVVFVGSHPYPHPEWEPYRTQLIRRMQSEFGRRFAVWPKRGQPIRGRALQTLYASARVVVGDSCLAGETHQYVSDRVPETLGRGGLLVHPFAPWMTDWWEPDMDLLTYHQGDFGAAVEAVDWALDHPTEAREIAEHGRETVLARDTYRHRMATVLGHVAETLGIGPSVPAARPVAIPAPAAAPAGPRPLRVRHRPTGVQAAFYVVAGAETDAVAVRECWTDDQYELTRTMVRGKTVVDIGANVGAFAVLAAKAGAARVVAYEPHPDTFAVLGRNVAENEVGTIVALRQQAVMDRAGFCVLVGAGGGTTAGPVGANPDEGVPALPLGDVLELHGPVGLLKVDAEAAEWSMFSSVDSHLLATSVERIVMEWHGPGMPHLSHLDDDGGYDGRWGRLVALLADCGRVSTFGHPRAGGILNWRRY